MASAFASYAHKDREFVKKLCHDLEDAGIDVWMDERELRIGDSIPRSLRKGIEKSQHFIVVLSSAALTSEWLQLEMDVALSLQIRSPNKKILPLLVDSVELPSMLEGRVFADFRTSYETGLSSLKRALGVDTAQLSVMVSVLVDVEGWSCN